MGEIGVALSQIDRSEKNTDYLTGLINRRGFYEVWEQIPIDTSVHCIYIDVDNFKLVNDIYGHARGDELLVYVAQILNKAFPQQLAVRMGGDEFVVVCDGAVEIERLKERLSDLQRMIKEEFDESLSTLLSFSMGLTVNQPVSKGASAILEQCDETMYYVKKSGKGKCVSYEEIEARLIEQKALKERALTALDENEITMQLQPVIHIQTSEVYAAQIVTKWNFPEFGRLPEEKYLPVFEQYGMILRLDQAVFEQACRWKNQWKGTEFEHMKLYVRISGMRIMQAGGISHMKKCLEAYGVPAQELVLCIEEKAFLGANEKMGYAIELLTKAGFDIAIQNFGSASSFMVLQNIPAKILKLDRTRLPLSAHDSEADDKKIKILRNVINMGRDLQFLVMAQGIQDSSQTELLANYGAQLGVGDFYGIAQSAEEFLENYKEHYYFSRNPKPTVYRFEKSLMDEEGKYEGRCEGDGVTYAAGVIEGQCALHFPGGNVRENLVSLPKSVMYSDSYTICVWVNTEMTQFWTSIFYVGYSDGFMSLVPSDSKGSCVLRLKDIREPNKWFDIFGCGVVPGQWAYLCISYDVISGMAKLYFNGLLSGSRDHAPNLKVINQILIGGDDFQESYRGRLAGLEIYHCVLSAEEIQRKFMEYQTNPTFLNAEG